MITIWKTPIVATVEQVLKDLKLQLYGAGLLKEIKNTGSDLMCTCPFHAKVRGLGYLINADSREQAVAQALENAQTKADKPYSRYKRCTFTVKDEDVIAKPDW